MQTFQVFLHGLHEAPHPNPAPSTKIGRSILQEWTPTKLRSASGSEMRMYLRKLTMPWERDIGATKTGASTSWPTCGITKSGMKSGYRVWVRLKACLTKFILNLYNYIYLHIPTAPKLCHCYEKVRRRSLDDVTLHLFYVIRCVHKMLIRTYVLRCTHKILHLTRLMHTFAHTEWYACPHHYGAHNPRHH